MVNTPPGTSATVGPDGQVQITQPAAPAHPGGHPGGGYGGGHHPDYLRLGSHGQRVQHWQGPVHAGRDARLQGTRHLDEATQEATISFQETYGLTADGIVGPRTHEVMTTQYQHAQQQPQQDQPYHPDTHGQFDPNQHGSYDPNVHGQYHPD